MGKSKNTSFLRGRRMRATVLDTSGAPVYGEDSVVVTKGFITVGYTTVTNEGEAITVTNAAGESCVAETATPTMDGFTVEATFCEVDYRLFEILTGQRVLLDDDGVAIGIAESTDVDLATVNFALELWLGSKIAGEWGYVLTPFLRGGIIGDVTIENAAITFTITGLVTKGGAKWGVGPYAVQTVGGEPSQLKDAVGAAEHRRWLSVDVAPPAVLEGSQPLLDPTDAAVTGLTTNVTGKSVAISPTPSGTDPITYDFGDGQWDYAATGSYTHVYASAGTYTITATRGVSTVTKSVTVS
jgi:PKD repeat protein